MCTIEWVAEDGRRVMVAEERPWGWAQNPYWQAQPPLTFQGHPIVFDNTVGRNLYYVAPGTTYQWVQPATANYTDDWNYQTYAPFVQQGDHYEATLRYYGQVGVAPRRMGTLTGIEEPTVEEYREAAQQWRAERAPNRLRDAVARLMGRRR